MKEMMEKSMSLLERYKEVLMYLLFGGCTTVLNLILYHLFYNDLGISSTVSVVVSNIFCILFAYVTNRKWVFEERATTKSGIVKEMTSFFTCRIFTLFLDVVIMYVTVDVLRYHPDLMKLLSNVVVVILNYVASKLLIFTKR